jgi:hypothetical protein
MIRTVALWLIALLVTLGSAYYQRATGPTYPLSGTVVLNGTSLAYQLDRSHSGAGDAPVRVRVPRAGATGTLLWRRFRAEEPWVTVPMDRQGDSLVAALPHQLPAGKLEYTVRIVEGEEEVMAPPDRTAVIRFKGDVPAAVLVVHIAAMFGAMLFSTRAALEVFSKQSKFTALTWWTIGGLLLGGLILGPIVQKYAFGAYWTGWPVGTDLTDNKTLIAMIGWLGAALALRTVPRPGVWVVLAALLMLGVFMIPHSLRGSERALNGASTGTVGYPPDDSLRGEKGLDKVPEIY